jgi:hypothetical protein
MMMKTLSYLFFASLVFAIISCDKVKDPIPTKTDIEKLIEQYYPGNPDDYDRDPTFTANTNTNRNVLLEDYTGHRCNNCPAAATIAKNIEASNPNRVFVLSVHAGGKGSPFQEVSKPGDSKYPKFSHDFRTQAGTTYAQEIAGIIGNPAGMISRTISQEGTPWNHSTNTWENKVNDILSANDLKANIQIKYNYYPETKGLFVHYELEALQALDDKTRVVVLLMEKEFISEQVGAGGIEIDDYKHHNVLVGNVSQIWGESHGALAVGEKKTGLVINGLNEMNTVATIDETDMAIVCFVINRDTYEVYQVIVEDVNF